MQKTVCADHDRNTLNFNKLHAFYKKFKDSVFNVKKSLKRIRWSQWQLLLQMLTSIVLGSSPLPEPPDLGLRATRFYKLGQTTQVPHRLYISN